MTNDVRDRYLVRESDGEPVMSAATFESAATFRDRYNTASGIAGKPHGGRVTLNPECETYRPMLRIAKEAGVDLDRVFDQTLLSAGPVMPHISQRLRPGVSTREPYAVGRESAELTTQTEMNLGRAERACEILNMHEIACGRSATYQVTLSPDYEALGPLFEAAARAEVDIKPIFRFVIGVRTQMAAAVETAESGPSL